MSTTDTTSIPFETEDKTRHRPAYASFGEDGLTATATAYGHLLQITQYFGNDPSGFYCVDLKDVLEPCWVTQRMEQLQGHIVDPSKGMRLEVESFNNSELTHEMPKLSFLNNRWPNFVTQTAAGNLKTEIQYFIYQKTVYQTYTFTSRDKSLALLPEMAINAELLIRNLDFSSSSIWNMQETSNSSYEYRSPQGKHCIIRMRETGTEQGGDANELAHDNNVVLAIWPFINDSPQSVRREGTTAKYIITHGNQVLDGLENVSATVTLAYTLHLVPLSEVEKISSPVSPMELLRNLKANAQNPKTSFENPLFPGEEYLDFTLKRNLEHILSVCSIPIFGGPEEKVRPTVLTCGDMGGHRVANEASL